MASMLHAWRSLSIDIWKAVLYVILIILCILMAPDEPQQFIYTEF